MSVVQFNLLPDVKLEFNQAQRTKRLVFTISFLVTAVVAVIFIISLVTVDIFQKKLLNDANKHITQYSNQLKGVKDLDKILTIQNQLNSLPNLHQSKHITSRLFDYLPQITPVNASIGKLNIDTSANTIIIAGTADTAETVNKFVDTMKFTTYTTKSDKTKKLAFSNVVVKSARNDQNATYEIDASYDPALFDATQQVSLTVPQEITTRSVLNAPGVKQPLFNGQTGQSEESQNSTSQGGQ